jgi:hypothetical protein
VDDPGGVSGDAYGGLVLPAYGSGVIGQLAGGAAPWLLLGNLLDGRIRDGGRLTLNVKGEGRAQSDSDERGGRVENHGLGAERGSVLIDDVPDALARAVAPCGSAGASRATVDRSAHGIGFAALRPMHTVVVDVVKILKVLLVSSHAGIVSALDNVRQGVVR